MTADRIPTSLYHLDSSISAVESHLLGLRWIHIPALRPEQELQAAPRPAAGFIKDGKIAQWPRRLVPVPFVLRQTFDDWENERGATECGDEGNNGVERQTKWPVWQWLIIVRPQHRDENNDAYNADQAPYNLWPPPFQDLPSPSRRPSHVVPRLLGARRLHQLVFRFTARKGRLGGQISPNLRASRLVGRACRGLGLLIPIINVGMGR